MLYKYKHILCWLTHLCYLLHRDRHCLVQYNGLDWVNHTNVQMLSRIGTYKAKIVIDIFLREEQLRMTYSSFVNVRMSKWRIKAKSLGISSSALIFRFLEMKYFSFSTLIPKDENRPMGCLCPCSSIIKLKLVVTIWMILFRLLDRFCCQTFLVAFHWNIVLWAKYSPA